MSHPVISVHDLSKRYVIGHKKAATDGIRHVIEAAVRAPFKYLSARREEKKQAHEEFWALNGVSFDIHQGEVVGFLGRNGAGKSTMLKLLSRITEPTRGRIYLEGRTASLLEVGTGFHPELTGRENIFLNGAILGMGKAEIKRKFDEIVAFSEIEQFLDTPVKRYSSGMYVRLAFSVAAHLDPDTLIVDEVLAVGDSAFQSKCVAKMQEARRHARTVLFVSHNLKAVESFCSRGIVLERGRVTFDGPVKDALKHYLSSQKVELPSAFQADIDLTGSTHRPGTFTPQLRRLKLYDGDNRPFTGNLLVGGSLKAVIEVELLKPTERVDAELAFFTPFGERVCTAHSAYEPEYQGETRSGRQIFTCDISHLPLMPGEYNLHVGLDATLKQVDCCRNVAQITVTGGDFYGTGVEPSQGSFLLKNRWRINAA